MDKLVTVAIALYNNANYIERCVKSVIAQTYSNLEILLVDDGSTDDSLQRVEKYKSEGRLRVITKENGGLSSVRQVALDEAKGDYICFIDADDYLVNTHVEILLNKISKDNSDICVCSTRFEQSNGEILVGNTKQFTAKETNKGVLITDNLLLEAGNEIMQKMYLSDSWNKMYRLAFLRMSGTTFSMPRGLNGTDSIFNKKLIFHNPICSSTSSTGYVHVIYNASAVHRRNKDLLSSYIIIAKHKLEECRLINKDAVMKGVIYNSYLQDLRSAYQDVFNEDSFGLSVWSRFENLYNRHLEFSNEFKVPYIYTGKERKSQILFLFLLKNMRFLLPLYFLIRRSLITAS